MLLSKSSDYALKATVYIAKVSKFGKIATLTQISDEIDTPEAFTSKILQRLVKNGIIDSIRGKFGGYIMNQEQILKTTVLDVLKAIEGDALYNGCVMAFNKCNHKKPCLLHHQFTVVRNNIKNTIRSTTIDDLLFEFLEKRVVLRR